MGADFEAKVAAYLGLRRALLNLLNPRDRRYFSFQLWQEGIARYTQYRVAAWAAANFEPSSGFRSFDDYVGFERVAERLRAQVLSELEALELPEGRRVAFYPLGAAEGLLLDVLAPAWRARYFDPPFQLETHFAGRR